MYSLLTHQGHPSVRVVTFFFWGEAFLWASLSFPYSHSHIILTHNLIILLTFTCVARSELSSIIGTIIFFTYVRLEDYDGEQASFWNIFQICACCRSKHMSLHRSNYRFHSTRVHLFLSYHFIKAPSYWKLSTDIRTTHKEWSKGKSWLHIYLSNLSQKLLHLYFCKQYVQAQVKNSIWQPRL